MSTHPFRLVLLFLPVLLSGCLEFEKQSLSYRVDKQSDTLLIFQDYRGIFGADAEGKAGEALTGEEARQLESVLEGQRTFFFNNWIYEYERAQVEAALADLKDPAKRAERKLTPEGFAKTEALLKLLLASVRVENGPFYLDAEKKLCGVQSVTVSKLSSLIKATNECVPFLLQEHAADETVSAADRAAIAKFLKANRPCVATDGNAITLLLPTSRASFDESFGPDSEGKAKLEETKRAGLGISFADDVATIELGKPDDEITELTLTFSKENYTPNALAAARKQHVVKESFDPAAAAKEFLRPKAK